MKKTVKRLFYIIAFVVGITAISISSVASYATGAEISHKIESYQADSGYNNPIDGCKIKGYFSEDATSLQLVTYTAVKINFENDVVTVDSESGVISLNGKEITDDDIVEKDGVKEKNIVSLVQNVVNPSPKKSKYVEVVAHEWCAFVFAVHYKGINNEDLVTYASSVVTCTSLDTGTPEVYRTGTWIKYADYIEYDIMIRSDARKKTRSHDSGLSYFVVYKGTKEIDRITNIGKTFYQYKLNISLIDIAYYEIYAVDMAGNKILQRVAENNNIKYDEGFESAVINALTYLEGNELYATSVKANLEKAYYDYYMAIQVANAKEEDIIAEKNKTLPFLTEYARLKTLEQAKTKEYTLKISNGEYVAGEITLSNANTALASLLYGEKAIININVASFDPNKIDKYVEMQAAGIKRCKEILSFTITYSKNNIEFKEAFTNPLQIAVPLSNYKNIKAIINIPNDDNSYTIKTIDITRYNDYIVLNTPYSYGTISLFIDENTNNPLLWLLTLLVIPVGLFIFAVIKVINKNKKKNLEGKNDKRK